MTTLPPRKPNSRPPIRWDRESETAQLFYAVKRWGKRNHPDRHWTNDTTFDFLVKEFAQGKGIQAQQDDD